MKDIENLSLPIKYEIQNSDIDDRFTKLKIYVMHDGLNLNNSYFDMEAIENAKDSIKNIPILAFVKKEDGNDNSDFAGHEYELVIDKDGIKYRYLGRPIGVIPADNNNYRYEIINDRTYVVVDGYVWNEYANEAIDIIKKDKEKSQSMEIKLKSYTIDVENNRININDYIYTGLTLLGDNVTPAMTGAKAEVYSFDKEYFVMVEELNNVLKQQSSFEDVDIDNKEGGSKVDLDKLLEKFSITIDELSEKIPNYKDFSLDDLERELFSLTAKQLKKEIISELTKEKITDKWGYEYYKYWYVDHDEKKVYVEDSEDYKLYSFNYTTNKDTVQIDFESRERVKIQYVPFEGKDIDDEFTLVSKERYDAFKEKEIKKIKEKYTSQLNEYKEKVENAKNKYDEYEKIIKELKEFKENKLKEERRQAENQLFEMFASQLSEDDIDLIKEKASEYTLEELERELYFMVGKKVTNAFSVKKDKNNVKTVKVDLLSDDKDKENSKSYDYLFEKFN